MKESKSGRGGTSVLLPYTQSELKHTHTHKLTVGTVTRDKGKENLLRD